MRNTIRFALFALVALAALAPAQAQFIPVYGSRAFIKGANLPWLDGAFSDYLAVDPHHPTWGVYYNSQHMNSYLADMHKMGINVVRLWLFQDDQGCTLDGSGNVTGVTAQFWANLDDTVKAAGNSHIALYLTLNGGRADIQESPTLLNSFIANALKPMIQRYKGDQRVFAIDAMNEIDGTVAGSSGNYTTTGSTWAQAQNYMRTIAAAVHGVDPGRLVSCSSGWHAWNNLNAHFKGLGLDFYDFHQYDDTGYIPSAASLGMDKPVYMGECGQGSSNTRSDSLQNAADGNFLNNGRNGYAGIGVWCYEYPGSTDVHAMLETNGSWRPVCYTIQNFNYGGSNLIADGTYTLTNKNSGLALDVPGYSATAGRQLDQWAASGGSNQKFKLTNLGGNVVSLVSVSSGLAVDVYGASSANGAVVDQWAYGGGANQQWTVSPSGGGYYSLTNKNSGLALEVTGAAAGNGGLIDQWPYGGGGNQLWSFH